MFIVHNLLSQIKTITFLGHAQALHDAFTFENIAVNEVQKLPMSTTTWQLATCDFTPLLPSLSTLGREAFTAAMTKPQPPMTTLATTLSRS